MKSEFNASRKSGAATRARPATKKRPALTKKQATLNLALLNAANGDNIRAMRDALAKGADINGATAEGTTALHFLCSTGREDHIRELVGLGAKTDIADVDGYTPLLRALQAERPLVAKWLLEQGADANVRTKAGVAAIHFAAQKGDLDLLTALRAHDAALDVVPLDHEPPVKLGSYTPLVTAIMYHFPDFTRALIEAGADVNLGAEWGDAALHWAAWEGEKKSVQLLVEHGARIDCKKPESGETPLCMAVTMGWDGIVDYLVEKGADVHSRMDDGKTLLMVAAENGHEKIAETLIDHGVSLSARDEKGRDALQIARDEGRTKMVEKLSAMISRHNAQKIKTLYMKRMHRFVGATP